MSAAINYELNDAATVGPSSIASEVLAANIGLCELLVNTIV
jgi:hypothetical protein